MTPIMALIAEASRLRQGQFKFRYRRTSMTAPTNGSKYYRYELVHGDDADFIAYQRQRGDGAWQTFSTWMIPRACA
jgi:hypothetical protein